MQREVTSGHPRSCREKAHQCSHFYGSHYPNLLKSNEFYRKTGLCENRVPKNSLQKSSKSARELESASELDLESELFTRASRERERERACERAGELARSLAKNLKSSSSRSLARRKIEVSQLALARSRKFLPVFCTLKFILHEKIRIN